MSVQEQLESVRKNFLADLESFPDNSREIEGLRSKYLGRKGDVASLFSLMGKASAEERPILGQKLNALKDELSDLFERKVSSVSKSQQNAEDADMDLTLPGKQPRMGSIHVLEQTLSEIKDIFKSIGFHVSYGPEAVSYTHLTLPTILLV